MMNHNKSACNSIVDHWLSTTALSTFDILLLLLKAPPDSFLEESGFVFIKDTHLAVPQKIAGKDLFMNARFMYDLFWQLVHHPQCFTESMYAFVLDETPPIACEKLKLVYARLRKTLFERTSLDLATTQAFGARRFDLQCVVLSGYKVLQQMYKTPEKIQLSLESALGNDNNPWKICMSSPFFNLLKDTLEQASIAYHIKVAPKPLTTFTPSTLAVFDTHCTLHLLRKDKFLLVYLLTFASSLAHFLTKPLNVQVPLPLAQFIQSIYCYNHASA